MRDALISESIPVRRERIDVGVLVELTTEVMQRQAKELGVTLRIHIDDAVPTMVSLDRDKVGWVITSLVGSALRHVRPRDGQIAVDVAYDASQAMLSFVVHDNGPGIPREQLNRLLNRGPWRAGSALALLLIADIASAHGGNLAIESQTDSRDHFTKISFVIPVEGAGGDAL